MPGADVVWQRIGETERALRELVRDVYRAQFGERAAQRIEDALAVHERETLERALRNRPSESDALGIVDYLYLGQLPPLLFAADVWQEARRRLGNGSDVKPRLQTAIAQIASVRNEIAHVREVERDRLLRTTVACGDVLAMLT
jgi:hypothetical protein